ncbi:hypothetical protein [Nocardia sp. CC201C]|uniref:hypothetical protein n=1 Tax=Nocardia sp. CC201C TaxID=3044575 RepID=UPI0024A91F19|nr:hypothetical protein [Nocardia sp. CC201C]
MTEPVTREFVLRATVPVAVVEEFAPSFHALMESGQQLFEWLAQQGGTTAVLLDGHDVTDQL